MPSTGEIMRRTASTYTDLVTFVDPTTRTWAVPIPIDYVVIEKSLWEKTKEEAGLVEGVAYTERRAATFKAFHAVGTKKYGSAQAWADMRPSLCHLVSLGRTFSSRDLTTEELQTAIGFMEL